MEYNDFTEGKSGTLFICHIWLLLTTFVWRSGYYSVLMHPLSVQDFVNWKKKKHTWLYFEEHKIHGCTVNLTLGLISEFLYDGEKCCLKYWFVSIFKLLRGWTIISIYDLIIHFFKTLFYDWVLCAVQIHCFIKADCRYSSGSDESRLAIQWTLTVLNRDLYGSSSMDFSVVEFKGAPPPQLYRTSIISGRFSTVHT